MATMFEVVKTKALLGGGKAKEKIESFLLKITSKETVPHV